MKKLFIGCGIVVLLIVGGLGYLTYQVYPQLKEWQAQWIAAFDRLQALERSHPFDREAQSALPLDSERFAASLDLRATLAADLQRVGAEMDELAGTGPDGERKGTIEMIRGMFRTAAPLLPNFAQRLEDKQMSWPEFAWHTRLLWACLIRVDAGVGPDALSPLKGSYDQLQQNYARLQEHNGKELPNLADLIGTFPLPLVNEASALLAQDLDRVRRGLEVIAVDHFYMQPISRLEDLQSMQVAQEDIARRKLEEHAAGDDAMAGHGKPAEPAGAPVPLGNAPQAAPAPASKPAEPDKPGGK